MGGPAEYRYPYATTPGASTAGPSTTPEEGTRGLWEFFWLSVLSTAIIAVAGVTTWVLVHAH
jgi:hypothetical protein